MLGSLVLGGWLAGAQPPRGLGPEEVVEEQTGLCGYRAVFFAVQDYDDAAIQDLSTPLSDVDAISGVLERRYGFAVERHDNPDRAEILDRLVRLQDEVAECEAVVIYFAGHGVLDERLDTGFWLARDARPASSATWISNADVSSRVAGLPARHVAMLVDSCFGGSFVTRTMRALQLNRPEAPTNREVTELLRRPSRWVIASGGEEPVADDFDGRGMSVFAHFLHQNLDDAPGPFVKLDALFVSLREQVGPNSEQLPVQGPLKKHEGGSLVMRVAGVPVPPDAPRIDPPPPPSRPLSIEMVRIEGGEFLMGSPADEAGRGPSENLHPVKLRTYSIMTHEVTQGLYVEIMGSRSNPSRHAQCGERCPVDSVSWWEAVGFANALSLHDNLRPAYEIDGEEIRLVRGADGYRLPTEAEWERAARGGATDERFSGGPKAEAVGWIRGAGRTRPVEGKKPNRLGLYDMTGNVAEWVWDAWSEPYPTHPVVDPSVDPRPGHPERVVRGGSWSTPADYARVAARDVVGAEERHATIGFRLARSR